MNSWIVNTFVKNRTFIMVHVNILAMITLVDHHSMVLQCLLQVLSSHQPLLLLYCMLVFVYVCLCGAGFVLFIAYFMLNSL